MNYMTMLYKVVGDDWVENGRRCPKLGKDMKSWMRWGGNATNHILLLLPHNFSKYILLLARCSTWAILPWPQTMWIEGIHVKASFYLHLVGTFLWVVKVKHVHKAFPSKHVLIGGTTVKPKTLQAKMDGPTNRALWGNSIRFQYSLNHIHIDSVVNQIISE